MRAFVTPASSLLLLPPTLHRLSEDALLRFPLALPGLALGPRESSEALLLFSLTFAPFLLPTSPPVFEFVPSLLLRFPCCASFGRTGGMIGGCGGRPRANRWRWRRIIRARYAFLMSAALALGATPRI